MKSRFSTVDIKAVLLDIKEQFSGLRVANIYDIDSKTYLIKFTKPDSKKVLLIESGIRIHITEYDWPKSNFPSGFSMKMRKHLKSRRLEVVRQLGNDRIVQLQFGSGDAAYHIILELYDRGNIILTDHEFMILNILRQRADNSQDVKFAVREKYPLDLAQPRQPLPTLESLHEMILAAKTGDNLRRILNPKLAYGPAVIDHCLQSAGFPPAAAVGRGFDITCDLGRVLTALETAEELLVKSEEACRGYIIQKAEKKAAPSSADAGEESSELLVYDEFHPFLYKQHEEKKYLEFDSFNQAVDQFFSQIEAQKIEMKTIQAERSALKKLDNVKRDHEKRLNVLQSEQELDENKANIIQSNLHIVEKALSVVRSALANQIDWSDIEDIITEAQSHRDPVALAIKSLKLQKSQMTLLLNDEDSFRPVAIDIDIGLSAHANAKRYFSQKKHASQKERKTVDASAKALKSAERKTKQVLKEMKVTANIVKARKVMWFEKFNWFISSENYLVIAGRDGQQNETLVRRYLKAGDVYVHADIHGASSLIVKNTQGGPIPPKTLNEAGTMAICHSAAWDAKVVTSAWWVHHDQVSKTAPSGEYLTTGSFMIRGKKNFLPPSYLVYGFGLLFKLDEDSLERHRGERKVRVIDDDSVSVATETEETEESGDVELQIDSGDSDEEDEVKGESEQQPTQLETVNEDHDEDHDQENSTDSNQNQDSVTDDIDSPHAQGDETGTESAKNKTIDSNDAPVTKTEPVDEIDGVDDEDVQEVEDNTGDKEMKEEEEDDEEEAAFPDTQIDLQHVAGSKFELRQRSISQVSGTSGISAGSQGHDDADGMADDMSVGSSQQGKPVLSRKQRRDMKKAKKQGPRQQQPGDDDDEVVDVIAEQRAAAKSASQEQQSKKAQSATSKPDQVDTSTEASRPHSTAGPNKRGQSGKLKKMKKKYGDQDEEERELRLEILQSAQRETKKRQKQKQQKQQQEEKQQRKAEQAQKQAEYKKKQIEAHKAKAAGRPLAAEAQGFLDDDDMTTEGDNLALDETGVLDSLTGLPVEDDTLLYAIPFCAPYSALQNFKHKVKLIPGNTKRGKAVKASVHAFMFDKSITQREKDLIKSLKDVDMSRNVPGKVKVTSSQVNKAKSKRSS